MGIVRAPVHACPTRGVRWFWVRGGPVRRGWRAGVPCPETAGRRSTRPPAPPRLSPRSQNPILLPPSLVGKKKKKKRRSLAHRNVGREGSRGPHHTTPHRGASSAIAAFYPPGTPSLCRCCTHPYRALASTSLVSSLGFSALVFSGFSAAGPPRDCQTRKKKKKKLF